MYVDQIPLSSTYREVFDLAGGWAVPLSSGDDYELCFTLDDRRYPTVHKELESMSVPVSCIGMIESETGLRLQMPDGSMDTGQYAGYEHFIS